MKIAQVIKHYGSKAETCDALGVTRSAFSHWLKIGYVPYKKQCIIQKLTNNKLKACHTEIHAALKAKFNN